MTHNISTNIQPELVFTRRYSMGHRLIEAGSDQCAIPHGHNEYVTVAFGPGKKIDNGYQLNGKDNMLIPFFEAKKHWHAFIDEKIDHSFQISEKDPLLEWFLKHEPKRARRLVVTPGDPTTELLAALLMAKLNAFLDDQGNILEIKSLEIKETPTNTVRLIGNNASAYLPTRSHDHDDWWQRADFSISNLFFETT